jgi:hypothetical protein
MSINGRGEMTPKMSRGRTEGGFLGILHAAPLSLCWLEPWARSV